MCFSDLLKIYPLRFHGKMNGRRLRQGPGSVGSFDSMSDEGEGLSPATSTCFDFEDKSLPPPSFRAPILGYEVMEERAKFTVFKLRIERADSKESWHIFRRYTDFVRLQKKLKAQYRSVRLHLPPKKWFGNNYDQTFLEDRLLGLQTFVNNTLVHPVLRNNPSVRGFFCLDDPPGPNDTLEEAQAHCEQLEDVVYRLKEELKDKQSEIEMMRAEIELLRVQQKALIKGLRLEVKSKSGDKSVFGSARNLNKTLLTIVDREQRTGRSTSLCEIHIPSKKSDSCNSPLTSTPNCSKSQLGSHDSFHSASSMAGGANAGTSTDTSQTTSPSPPDWDQEHKHSEIVPYLPSRIDVKDLASGPDTRVSLAAS